MSDALQQAVLPLKPQSVQDFGNGAQSGAAVLVGTQNAVSYVLGLRTPLLRQGEVTVFFSFVHFWCYLNMVSKVTITKEEGSMMHEH